MLCVKNNKTIVAACSVLNFCMKMFLLLNMTRVFIRQLRHFFLLRLLYNIHSMQCKKAASLQGEMLGVLALILQGCRAVQGS